MPVQGCPGGAEQLPAQGKLQQPQIWGCFGRWEERNAPGPAGIQMRHSGKSWEGRGWWDQAITRELISQTRAWPSQRSNGSCLSLLAVLFLSPEQISLLDLLPVLLGRTLRGAHTESCPPNHPKNPIPALHTSRGGCAQGWAEAGSVLEAQGELWALTWGIIELSLGEECVLPESPRDKGASSCLWGDSATHNCCSTW